MMRSLRLIWPPWWALFWAGLVYAAFEAFILFMEWRFDLNSASPVADPLTVMVLGFCASLYAVYRIWTFHPATRPVFAHTRI